MHPNIISVFDVGTFGDGNLFIAMEYLQGQTLEAFTRVPDLLPVEQVVAMVADVCLALSYAHRCKIVHRDIKPSNLMLVDGERVKITDFGIAKDRRTDITQCGTFLGTPSYMSPEQATGGEVDGRSDLFSLGVVLFELLTGERPFEGDSVSAVLYQLVHEEPREPRVLNHRLPEPFDDLLRTALHKNPDCRFQTGREMADALRNFRQFVASPAQTVVLRPDFPGTPPPRRPADPTPQPAATTPAPAQPAPARRTPATRSGVLAAGAVAVAVVLVALALPDYRKAWLGTVARLLQPSQLTIARQPAAKRPTIEEPALAVKVDLVADRPGARFYVDGAPVDGDSIHWQPGQAASTLTASDGCYRGEVLLEASSATAPGRVEVRLDEPIVRTVTLGSQPEPARVKLDGDAVKGRTPVALSLQACVDHEIAVAAEGFQPRTVALPSGEDWEEMLGAPLRLEPLPEGRLIVDSPYPVTVRANERQLGASGEVLSLAPGSRELTFENHEHRVQVTREYQVEPGAEAKITAPVPALGSVRVLAYPGNALILVDGIEAEPPPLTLQLGAGEHTIECRWNVGGLSSREKTLVVQAGQIHSVHFRDEE
jgi:hypothetical protein